MPYLVFVLPFKANLSLAREHELEKRLQLTMNRTDDWDAEIGFRLIGRTGALSLLRLERVRPENNLTRYGFYGTAIDQDDRSAVGELFGLCKEAIPTVEGHIERERVVAPPGQTYELSKETGRSGT
jgi:hypothetical protein